MILQFTVAHSAHPMVLVPRAESNSGVLLLAIVVSIVCISFARLSQKSVVVFLLRGVFTTKNQEEYNDGTSSNFLSTSLLTFQFCIITATITYWLFYDKIPENQITSSELIAVFSASAYLMYCLILSFLTGKIGGLVRFASEVNWITLILTQLFGIVLLVEFFIGFFQFNLQHVFIYVMLSTFGVYLATRFVRILLLGFRQGIAWYYLILYLWSLEILPVIIIVKLLINNDFQLWIG